MLPLLMAVAVALASIRRVGGATSAAVRGVGGRAVRGAVHDVQDAARQHHLDIGHLRTTGGPGA